MRDLELLKVHSVYKKQLQSTINAVRKRLEKNRKNVPAGILKYHRSKSGKYYYSLITDNGKNEKYLRKEKRTIAAITAQNEYDSTFLKNAEVLMEKLTKFDQQIEESGIESIYNNASEAKKQLITPVIPTPEKQIADWENYDYERKTIGEGVPDYITEKKEHVRSKSELIIANALFRHNIPYRYECPVEIGGRVIHPDFSILDVRSGKTVYWEHLGMLDDYAYRSDAIKRIASYESDGIFSGIDIIYTIETIGFPLTPVTVERKIQKYFCD